jgi:hypothetical protein
MFTYLVSSVRGAVVHGATKIRSVMKTCLLFLLKLLALVTINHWTLFVGIVSIVVVVV